MKKLLIVFCLALAFTSTVAAQAVVATDTVEYVFTEIELRDFLREQIRVAVDTVTADLLRQHAIEIALKDHAISARDIIIADYEKQLKAWPCKQMLTGASAAVVGISLGLLVGILAF